MNVSLLGCATTSKLSRDDEAIVGCVSIVTICDLYQYIICAMGWI